MCGIAGIVMNSKPGDQEWISGHIKKMTDTIIHRGPDGEGHFIGPNFALGHRRLSIIDLSEAAAQPMTWNGLYTITYNGEVYNYLEIRKELERAGYWFDTQSDTEVILAAYDRWGVECVGKFNGMWSFAIYDRKREILFCSRDRFGVKPFYYKNVGGIFAFGSEIRELLALSKESPVANETVILNYLILNLIDYDEQTFFKDIFKLPGGHNLVYSLINHTLEIRKYYEIAFREEIRKLSFQETLELYGQEFERSVRYRLRSDVKVGTCLSGGLDSSTVAAAASLQNKELAGLPFCAVTGQSIDKQFDETGYAMRVVNSHHLDWYVTCPERDEFMSILDDGFYAQEYPFIGPTVFMQYFVMKKARESGITVMLDGQGGDETLLGYRRYIPAILRQDGLQKFLLNFSRVKKNYSISAAEILQNILYFSLPSIRTMRQIKAFPNLRKEKQALLNTDILIQYANAYSDPFELQKLEFTTIQIPSLLRFEDKNAMRHSIETRLPFLDWELVEISLSMHSSMKLHEGWSKYILRRYASSIGLPDEIAWRRTKLGFNAPVGNWLTGFEKEMMTIIHCSDLIGSLFKKNPEQNDINRTWRLFNLAKWEKLQNLNLGN